MPSHLCDGHEILLQQNSQINQVFFSGSVISKMQLLLSSPVNRLCMKQIVFYFVLSLLFACQSKVKTRVTEACKYPELKKAEWLLGSWQKQSAKGILTESWQKLNDSTLVGQSNFVSGNDTISSEIIRLEQRNGKLYYIPTVLGKNEGKAIIFALTSLTDSTVTFENPVHDFPQKIEYWFQKPDSLNAEVSSVAGELKKSIVFRMKRVN